MVTLPLVLQGGHLFMRVGPEWFLIDTGSAVSFAERGHLWLDGQYFPLPRELPGLSLPKLRWFTREPGIAGLLGNDVLGKFDHVWDVPGECVTVSRNRLEVEGDAIEIEAWGLPQLPVFVEGEEHWALFDTGAKVSYFSEDVRSRYRYMGHVDDFHTSRGLYKTPTSLVPMTIGETDFNLLCASYEPLGWHPMSGGIVGNDVLKGRVSGYFPRRDELVLGEAA